MKIFCVGSNNHESFLNKGAHPFHRSWRQRMFDEYVHEEVLPFIYADTQSPGIAIATMGASLGAYHAANTLFRYPHQVKRCYALSGIYDLRDFMGGMYDDNFYFHNPVDYLSNMQRSVGIRAARVLRNPAGDRVGPVGEEPPDLRAVGSPLAEGNQARRGRLGSARRPRLAVLEGRDARISEEMVSPVAGHLPVVQSRAPCSAATNLSAPPSKRWFFAGTS